MMQRDDINTVWHGGMVDDAMYSNIRRLRLWAQHSLSGAMHGIYTSSFMGSGLECDDFREYTPGDDVKHIDWKLTARSQNPHIRLFREERDLTLLVLVDTSSSMYFGSNVQREKIHMSMELTALLCALAKVNHDRSALGLFSQDVMTNTPPAHGDMHFYRILQAAMSAPRMHQKTSIRSALSWAMRFLRKKSLVVVISDFLDSQDYMHELQLISCKHDVTCLKVYDPIEKYPPKSWYPWMFYDNETGKQWSFGDDHRLERSQQRNMLYVKRKEEKSSLNPWLAQIRRTPAYALEVNCQSLAQNVLLRILHRNVRKNMYEKFRGIR